jgi:hypothetical protein
MLKFQLTSPKYQPDIKTERKKIADYKEFENVEITPFDVQKPTKMLNSKQFTNVLTPVNKNLHVEEPKRPKILNKQRISLSFFEEFKLGKILGKGRFGNVYRAQHNATRAIFAVKQISL